MYDDHNRGALFKNERKTEDTHADYTGTLDVGGKNYWLNAWLKTSKAGTKYLSVSVKPKEAAAANKPKAQAGGGAPYNDEIPFLPERR